MCLCICPLIRLDTCCEPSAKELMCEPQLANNNADCDDETDSESNVSVWEYDFITKKKVATDGP